MCIRDRTRPTVISICPSVCKCSCRLSNLIPKTSVALSTSCQPSFQPTIIVYPPCNNPPFPVTPYIPYRLSIISLTISLRRIVGSQFNHTLNQKSSAIHPRFAVTLYIPSPLSIIFLSYYFHHLLVNTTVISI